MKTLIQNKNRKLKSEFFKIWKIFIKRTKQEKDCKQLIVSFQLSRYYGRWQLAYKQIVENREISFVRSRVVETRLKKRVFAFWLDRAIYNFKRRQIRAIKFKRKYIKIRFFKAWYNYSKMIQIRSEEYYKTITIEDYALTRPDKKEDYVKTITVIISYKFNNETQTVELSTVKTKGS